MVARGCLMKINDHFLAVDAAEHEATRALAFIDRLEQSILTRAFRGELAPQDPRDEPASALLARLGNGSPRAARRRGHVAA